MRRGGHEQYIQDSDCKTSNTKYLGDLGLDGKNNTDVGKHCDNSAERESSCEVFSTWSMSGFIGQTEARLQGVRGGRQPQEVHS
jgi:hypothetical protein